MRRPCIVEVVLQPADSRTAAAFGPLAGPLVLAASAVLLTVHPPPASPSIRRYDDQPGIERFEYASPRPGSSRVSRWNNIVLREGSVIDPASLAAARLSVVGAASGSHAGAWVLSDDSKTIVFTPALPFAPGEEVEVELEGGVRTVAGEALPRITFSFSVAQDDASGPMDPALAEEPGDDPSALAGAEVAGASRQETAAACGPLPSTYPPISLLLSNDPEPGYVFIGPYRTANTGHLLILDNLANPVFYRQVGFPPVDFKLQADGRITYFQRAVPGVRSAKFYVLDAAYSVVDSFTTGNGYVTDSHDLILLPNGHALLMSYDPRIVRMDLIVPGGRPNARVIGLIIQELDAGRNVVFQWRSWDHFLITDVVSPTVSLTGSTIDYAHGNALEVDPNGDILISSRHMNEITKISRTTGEVLWRLGRHARNNQFAFVNDDRGFSHQHDIRRLPNGHITLFDNGNFLSPEYSRAVEYEIDEAARTATLVWEYRNTPDTFGSFLGSARRRASGATMMGWGGTTVPPNVTDLHPDGTKAFELSFAGANFSYRAFRFPWRTTRFTTDRTSLDFGEVVLGRTAARTVTVRNTFASPITLDCAFSSDPAFTVEAPLPASLAPGEQVSVEVRFSPTAEARRVAKVYIRSTGAHELVAQDVEVAGTGVTNRPPDCRLAQAIPAELWAPSHQLVPIAIAGVTDPDGDPVTIEVTAIDQDEALLDDAGSTCPDAEVAGGAASVRAERSGTGDGRVYRIVFTARDPAGASSEGEVSVCVPHDRAHGASPGAGTIVRDARLDECHDGGERVSSLGPCPARGGGTRVAPVEASLAIEWNGAGGAGMTVEFSLPAEADVTIGVYDLAGRRVTLLEGGLRAAGSHRITWSMEGIPAGMYFCRVRAAGAVITRRVLVVR